MDREHRPPTLDYQPATSVDEKWLADRIKRDLQPRLVVRLDEDQDVIGHGVHGDPSVVRVIIEDEGLDTVGHAISIRLPSVEEADAFRRRVLLTGLLVGTVVLASTGAVLAVSQDDDAAEAPPATEQIEDVSYEDATPHSGTV